MANEQRFSIDELSALAEVPRRTVRYYIQQGLIERPAGAKRGAYYTLDHLEQLLAIRKWQREGLSLERIGELASQSVEDRELPPPRTRTAGDVSVRSHVFLGRGVELQIDPTEANLDPDQVRALVRQTAALLAKISGEDEKS